MKYIVDFDALQNCLNFVEAYKINGQEVVLLTNVKRFLNCFPKEAVEEQATDEKE